jgi:hypothetical protein
MERKLVVGQQLERQLLVGELVVRQQLERQLLVRELVVQQQLDGRLLVLRTPDPQLADVRSGGGPAARHLRWTSLTHCHT